MRIMDRMEDLLIEIIALLKSETHVDDHAISRILSEYNRRAATPERTFAKKHIVPYYLKTKRENPAQWEAWNVDETTEAALLANLRMKPRRTASGVATITVITKPWRCSGNCLFCPNDVRMPKSYLHDEPACQRAERNCFDPYLQATSRLHALIDMGHVTDKIELIILGGSWTDYPRDYQVWFAEQLFEALNDEDRQEKAAIRRKSYEKAGIACDSATIEGQIRPWQESVNKGQTTYNVAIDALYGESGTWSQISSLQCAGMDELLEQHRINETARHRVVGLVVETRPDAVDVESLRCMREIGATKIQMGIQSLDEDVLHANHRTGPPRRGHEPTRTACAIDLARLFGFKTHAHFMVNLMGSTPESDKRDYRRLMTEAPYRPDEVKIYPCALVAGTGLEQAYAQGSWSPYPEDVLVDVLASDVLQTPEFCRISRMIRDISADDILAGNKKTNLRQLVENQIRTMNAPVREIRWREISTTDADLETLSLEEMCYETLSTNEVFLQWVTPQNRIAGFLRLSLPKQDKIEEIAGLPIRANQAMIREVHVYGRVAAIGDSGEGAQHAGLGRMLIERACDIARNRGYGEINVISAVGTREYYRHLGFGDGDLYLVKSLTGNEIPSSPSA